MREYAKNAEVNDDTFAERGMELGQILLEDAAISPERMAIAQKRQLAVGRPLEHILLANGWIGEERLAAAQARQWQTRCADPLVESPDMALIRAVGAEFCLQNGILPLRRADGWTEVLCCDPANFSRLRADLSAALGQARMLICSRSRLEAALIRHCGERLIRRAESRVPAAQSCRSRKPGRFFAWVVLSAVMLTGALASAPTRMLMAVIAVALTALAFQTAFKLLCFAVELRKLRIERHAPPMPQTSEDFPLPFVSVLLPLYREEGVVRHLIARLSRLDYPRELMEVLLLVESDDAETRSILIRTILPSWIRVVEVPDGSIRTKPRALCYGLDFCKGDIIGVLDAEDRPEPDQLYRVARHFHHASPEVGCVQGALDFFNPATNWLSRCFTIEYAVWFRVLLPAIERLGLILPLGGTTCYFRREALENTGAWDAWNVTEDAELGVRLIRYGWRTEIVDTSTDEEANCRLRPWTRQRSRWLKGYAMTWAVHMRAPFRLWRDLGTWRFAGFQIQFLVLSMQHLLAPVLWLFWLLLLGWDFAVPGLELLFSENGYMTPLLVLLVMSGLLDMAIGLFATRRKKHRHLRIWVPGMFLYFPLACVSAWKAMRELLLRPFYWDKTEHGIYGETMLEPSIAQIPFAGEIGGTNASDLPRANRSPNGVPLGSDGTGEIIAGRVAGHM